MSAVLSGMQKVDPGFRTLMRMIGPGDQWLRPFALRMFMTTSPEPTAFTRMPCSMASSERTRENCASAPFDAA